MMDNGRNEQVEILTPHRKRYLFALAAGIAFNVWQGSIAAGLFVTFSLFWIEETLNG